MARLLSLRARKLAWLIQKGINFPLQVFHGSEFIGKALSCEQKLLVAIVAYLVKEGFEPLQQGLAKLFQFCQSSPGHLLAVVIQEALS